MDHKAVQEAMEQLRAAKEEIAKIQAKREEAEKNVQQAKAAVKSAERSNDSKNYADKTYWDERYQKADPGCAEDQVYEWYLDFEHIKGFMLDDINKIGVKQPHIMVSGCGNSTFCEDLCNLGIGTIVGMDYSPAVISLMEKRRIARKLMKLSYCQADARCLPEVVSNTYDVVVDKGTLDAITTGGATDGAGKQEHSEDAANYMIEVWRVLKTGGLFILVSTMPPQVLEALGIIPLAELRSGRSPVCDWNNGARVRPLTTTEGGQVYYYAIRKIAPCGKSTSHRLATAGAAPGSKEDIMAGIQALLAEARKAKEQMDSAEAQRSRAAAEVAEVENQKAALERRVAEGLQELEEEQQGGSEGVLERESHVQRAVEEGVRQQAPSVSLYLDRSNGGELGAGDTADVYFLLTHRDASQHLAGWSEDDSLCLVCTSTTCTAAGEARQGGGELGRDEALYKAGDQPYEVFEYTDAPRSLEFGLDGSLSAEDTALLQRLGAHHLVDPALDKTALGKVTLRMPTYGSGFHVSYVRTVTLPVTTSDHTIGGSGDNRETAHRKVAQHRVRLATTASFPIRAPVHGGNPDARGSYNPVLFATPSSTSAGHSSSNRGLLMNVRRRGAGPITAAGVGTQKNGAALTAAAPQLQMWAEDMCHIRTLVVTARVAKGPEGCRRELARCMAWATAVGEEDTQHAGMKVFVEVDVITLDGDSASANAVTTVCGVLHLSDALFQRSEFDLRRASVQVDDRGYVLCRLPYSPSPNSRDRVGNMGSGQIDAAPVSTGSSGFAALQDIYQQASTATGEGPQVETAVQCAFCRADVLRTQDVNSCRPLPSGLLDNMLHDFICCEELPSGSLTASELDTPRSALLYGDHYLSVHPSQVRPSGISVQCKAGSTQLDLLSGNGGTLATTPIALKGLEGGDRVKKCVQLLKSVINIDTCMISCARCDAYLGDGQLQGEGCEEGDCVVHVPSGARAPTNSGTSTDMAEAGQGTGFSIADLRDVRLALPNIIVSTSASAAGPLTPGPRTGFVCTQPEQGIARMLLHMSTVYGIASFVLYVADAEFCAGPGSAATQSVVVKIMSKEYRVAVAADDAKTRLHGGTHQAALALQNSIKVSFRVGDALNLMSGSEGRVPVQLHELQQVIAVLSERASWLCASPFPQQRLSYLLL